MNFKRSPSSTQDKNPMVFDHAKDFPTIEDLLKEQKGSNVKLNTVHHRRDLDSLG